MSQTKEVPSIERMMFVGMDIHRSSHTACVIDCFNRNLAEIELANSHEGFEDLVEKLEELSSSTRLTPVFGLEDAYENGDRLATYLCDQGYLVKSVNPLFTAEARRRTLHRDKSDAEDSRKIAKVLRDQLTVLPEVRKTDIGEIAADLKELVNERDFLVKEQTRVKNQVHRLLNKSYGNIYSRMFRKTFSNSAIDFWLAFPQAADLKKATGVTPLNRTEK